jgi:hypothetical protein
MHTVYDVIAVAVVGSTFQNRYSLSLVFTLLFLTSNDIVFDGSRFRRIIVFSLPVGSVSLLRENKWSKFAKPTPILLGTQRTLRTVLCVPNRRYYK